MTDYKKTLMEIRDEKFRRYTLVKSASKAGRRLHLEIAALDAGIRALANKPEGGCL